MVSEPFAKANLATERVSPVTQRIEQITGHSAYRQPFRTATPKNIYVPPAQTFTQTSVITPGMSTRHSKPLSEPVGKVSRPVVSRGTPVHTQTLPTMQRNLTPVPVPSDEGRTQGRTNVPRFSLPISASQPPTGPPSGPPGGDPPGSNTGGRNYGYNNSFGLRNQGSIGHTGMGAGGGPPGDPPGGPPGGDDDPDDGDSASQHSRESSPQDQEGTEPYLVSGQHHIPWSVLKSLLGTGLGQSSPGTDRKVTEARKDAINIESKLDAHTPDVFTGKDKKA